MRLVVDNSVTVGWIHSDQATPYAMAMLDSLVRYEALAPALWALEFSNALLVLLRRRRMTEAQRQAAQAQAQDWGIVLDTQVPRMAEISALALAHGLTIYDAAYLDCALRHHTRLATQDGALRKAATALDCWFDPNRFQTT